MGITFNAVGNEGGDTFVNDGAKQKCAKCGWDNHRTEQCCTKRHKDGTLLQVDRVVLHLMENEDRIEEEVSIKRNFGINTVVMSMRD